MLITFCMRSLFLLVLIFIEITSSWKIINIKKVPLHLLFIRLYSRVFYRPPMSIFLPTIIFSRISSYCKLRILCVYLAIYIYTHPELTLNLKKCYSKNVSRPIWLLETSPRGWWPSASKNWYTLTVYFIRLVVWNLNTIYTFTNFILLNAGAGGVIF